ncbi:ABC transporter substrate-binding protein [Kineococcus sp. SYSU DK018]|uniref:ABC transporter substrate-binding protein n=1 Tax=Kineococcus sp. SYSU DK018 TaxID=3383139 RepID=UPI003D7D469E
MAERPHPAPGAYRVALLLPRRGPSGMFGPACRAAAELAAAEVDRDGGVGGRPVELVDVDAGAEPAAVAGEVAALLAAGAVDAVSGWHLSTVRRAVAPVVAGRVPYVYATAYEGGERHDGVLCSGELPGEQVVAALEWLRGAAGLRHWFVVGDDYVWPRATARRVARALSTAGTGLRGSRFVPLGCRDEGTWRSAVADCARSGADGVLMLLVGTDGVRFNRAFAAAGLDAAMARFSPFMDETMLLASGPDATRGLFASAGWFAGLPGASAAEFSRGFATAFDLLAGTGPAGPTPAPGTMAEATYSALRLLAGLGGGDRPQVADVRRALAGAAWDSPHGTVRLSRGVVGHPVHVALADGVGFDVLARVSGAGDVPRA